MSTDPDSDRNRTKLLRARCYDCGWTSGWIHPDVISERIETHENETHESGAMIAIDHENVHRDVDPKRVLAVLDDVLGDGSEDEGDEEEDSVE